MQSAKTTIFDVAELAGVSIKTVSRVVNNERNVSDKTRTKVLDAIAELNYMPSNAARTLSGKRSYVIGLVYENPNEFSYIGDLMKGALQACDQEGYTLLLRPLSLPDPNIAETISRFVSQTRMDGLVLPAPLSDISSIRTVLKDRNMPFSLLTPADRYEEAINIECADEEASYRLTRYVIELGHRRVGFIKGHPDHGDSAKRFAGYIRALQEVDIPLDESIVAQGYFDFESGRACAAKLLDVQNRPTVIMASNDDMAAGVLFEARERSLTVPGDVSLVGFDDTALASHIWPPMTTVRQPIVEMGDAAVRMLIRQLRGEPVDREATGFDCEIMIRESTAPPKIRG